MNKKATLADYLLTFLLIFLGLITIYPFINTLAVAFNEGIDTLRGDLYFLPREWTLENFQRVFRNKDIYSGFRITFFRTIIGTFLNTLFTGILAYALSKKQLMFKKFYLVFFMITMYFSGLIIPNYLLFRSLNLLNSFAVLVLPYLINVYFMIMMMTFFKSIPNAIEESAKIDGAGDWRIFISLVLPLSKPIIAVIALYNAVFHWNQWFDAYLYVTNTSLRPLQNVLIQVINSARINEVTDIASIMKDDVQTITIKSIRAATMIVTIGPIIFIYPFIQKYFIKGVMIGSVKG